MDVNLDIMGITAFSGIGWTWLSRAAPSGGLAMQTHGHGPGAIHCPPGSLSVLVGVGS